MAETEPSAEDRKTITDIVKAFFTCLEEQSYEGIDSLFHEDGTMWDVFEPNTYRGVKARFELWEMDREQFQARGKFTWSIDEPDIDMWVDDLAVCRYHLKFAFAPPNAATGHIRITDVLLRDQRSWKIVHHFEAAAPGGPPPF